MARKCQHRAALELFKKVGDTATPAEIDKHVGGTGSYYSKHVSVMRRWGFEFNVEKDGRTIVRYTLTKVPANEAEFRTQPVAKTATKKAAPKSKPKAVSKPKAKKTAKEKNLDTMRSVLRKQKQEKKEMEEVLKEEPVSTSYSVDADWDSTEEIDISALV